MAVVVDTSFSTSNTHSVYLVGLDGHKVASVQAANAPNITSWPAASPINSLWSTYATTSNTRAYYLDGGTSVRYLAPDGSTGKVAEIPADASTRSFFAVSPDDRRIAVSVLDYSSPPIVHMRFYVQDLTGGPQEPVRIATNLFFWPIGWHGGQVVVQVGQPIPQTLYGAYPDGAIDILLIDPLTGSSVSVAGTTCLPQPSLATPAGIACSADGGATFRVIGWDGKNASFSGPLGGGGVSLSTDGSRVATTDAKGTVIIESRAGSSPTPTPAVGYPGESGWIDSSHFLYRLAGSAQEAIYDTTRNSIAPLAVEGHVVARLPGGL